MHEGRGRYYFLLLAALITHSATAQDITVRGGFLEDSLIIGQDVTYWIAAEYPPEMEMVFPDSNAGFGSFEWASKQFYPSQLVEGQAYDSTVYTLQSFEIDPIQYLKLDAYVFNDLDSIRFSTPRDSIYLVEMASVVTDTTSLKTNLDYQTVSSQFNYPLFYYIIGGMVLALAIFFIVFGKRIVRYFRLKKLTKEYRRFSETLEGYISSLKYEPSPQMAEQALSHWKQYQQKLEKIAFTTLTSKEILSLDFTKELETPLKSIDRAIYASRPDENLYQEFELVENFAQDRYYHAYDRIKNDNKSDLADPR